MKQRIIRFTAKVMFCVLAYELIIPATRTMALTSGPSQPEMASFEPVGTTDMVDLFTGDFNYNIPLMDIEGYPINIAYHSGATMEDEASWVGLGWNINPGQINRGVRGVPDDFKGDTLNKRLNILPEKDYRFRLGAEFKAELFGYDRINARVGVGAFISYNNYKGMGVGFDGGVALTVPYAAVGIGVSAGSQDGADINVDAGLGFATTKSEQNHTGAFSASAGIGFNTRSGLKDMTYGGSVSATRYKDRTNIHGRTESVANGTGGLSFGSSIPMGMQNYVPMITNATTMNAWQVQLRLGLEAFFAFPNMNLSMTKSTLTHEIDGSMASYGYLNLQDAGVKGIVDFSRDKDGVYNSSLNNLPMSGMAYDIYSVTAQGTGGMFRPYRNDVGTVYDPEVKSASSNKTLVLEFGPGIGIGGLFEIGSDIGVYRNRIESGPWYSRPFRSSAANSLFEHVVFRQGGEMTYNLVQSVPEVANHKPFYVTENHNMYDKNGSYLRRLPSYYSNLNNRNPRANHLSFLRNDEAAIPKVTFNTMLESYPQMGFIDNNAGIKQISRTGTVKNKPKPHHIGEITQVLQDGRRYVYGLPAKNNIQREATFSVVNAHANIATGLVNYVPGTEDRVTNTRGRDKFYQAVYTPAYAHSYLLTSVLSADYTDVTGDGLTEDDLGSYTKFNYTLVDSDYRWVAPYPSAGTNRQASYNPGFWSDTMDDKGHVIMGSKELWYLHSVESKNYIAEFYTSARADSRGITDPLTNTSDVTGYASVLGTTKSSASITYKLDSIKLYNKHDRFLNKVNAVPVKTVVFAYDYSLCANVPNRETAGGKLTLKRIYFKYGNSQKSLVNPYVFNYDNNIPYNFSEKDRWGNYKANDPAITNYEFPYSVQNKTIADANATAWHLKEIILPSGGRINVSFESDDYSYVQDKRAMEMIRIAGVGGSTAFDPRDILYENQDQSYDYIYFKRDKTREIAGRNIRENYLEGTDMLYFSFNIDIAARNRFEHIKGYAKVENIGFCNGNPNHDYGYIKVKKESAGGNSGAMLNPITLCGLNTGRYYLPHIIYPGFATGDPSDVDVLNGLGAAVKELFSAAKNVNLRFIKDGLSKRFKPEKSWVRLHSPGHTKLGGGSRVKTLTVSDVWNKMASNGQSADYGRAYSYTTLLDNTTPISSGVASYEPLIGGDENPLRQPVKYTADSRKLMPAVEFFQEEPFGESFYPPPVVGYSRVTVRSIHEDEGRSSKGEDEYQFYTAKDFPVRTEFTPKQTPRSIKQNSLFNRFEHLQVVQGYALVLNDMHGKSKSIGNYIIKQNTSGAEYRELITQTKYNYQVDGAGNLDNKVKAVKRGDDLASPVYSITDLILGEEVDLTVDNRHREMESQSTNISLNLNVVNFLMVTIPLPTVFFSDKNETSIFETMVATKIVQQYGVLKSIESTDHGARTTAENVLYDSETGQVLLTRTNNEYNDPISNINYPAYWANDRMGPAYYNVGYEEIVDTLLISNGGNGYLLGLNNKRYLKDGDELLLRFQNGSATVTERMWVNGADNATYSYSDTSWTCPTECIPQKDSSATHYMKLVRTLTATYPCAVRIEPRAKTPTGNPTYPWQMDNQVFKNVYVKVFRSGRRNMLTSSVQSVALAANFSPTTFTDLFTASVFGSAVTPGSGLVVAASANDYTEYATNTEFTSSGLGGTFNFNSFIKGERGNFRPLGTYAWMAPRRYVSNHSRKDGVFEIYTNLYQLDESVGVSCPSTDRNLIKAYPYENWKIQNRVASYNAYGLPREEQDAAGIYSAALYGHNFSFPVAVAANARNSSVRYFGFEDLMQLHQDNKTKVGIWESIQALTAPSTFVNTYGKKYGILTSNNYVINTEVSTEAAHTGRYSLKTNGTGSIPLGKRSDFSGSDFLYISLWVKSQSNIAPPASAFKLMADRTSYTVISSVSDPIDGWYKLEGKFSLPTKGTMLSLSFVNKFYLDDIRICPNGANMKSFAYDFKTFRLMAELDENNFATFYEYDQEGSMIRVKKETEQGILTVNEHRKSNAKHVQ